MSVTPIFLELVIMTTVDVVEKHPYGVFAVDIEATGANLFTDKCFAIGLAFGTDLNSYETHNVCLDLKKPEDSTWAQHWETCGFEKDCYDSFWSKNEDILNMLQDRSKVHLCKTEKAMVTKFQQLLGDIEKKFDKLTLVTDTTCFDTVWLTVLLQKYKYPGLAYKRDGNYRRGGSFETDSFRVGAYKVNPAIKREPWKDDEEFCSALTSPHDHHPEHDALFIYQTWWATVNVVTKNANTSQ